MKHSANRLSFNLKTLRICNLTLRNIRDRNEIFCIFSNNPLYLVIFIDW